MTKILSVFIVIIITTFNSFGQDEVAKQDELIKTIGLNRTEAFQIIDTQGRGRDEIDARVLWKNRVNNISTGTSVL